MKITVLQQSSKNIFSIMTETIKIEDIISIGLIFSPLQIGIIPLQKATLLTTIFLKILTNVS